MFHDLEMAPRDPILGLTEAFTKDPNPRKINLGVGVYQDATGRTPVLESVRQAAGRVVSDTASAGYLPITGSPDYARAVQQLLLGAEHEIVAAGRAATAQTPGGTGALRVAGDFLRKMFPDRRIWVSQPTWPNHPNVFAAAGLEVKQYAYFQAAGNILDFDAMSADLAKIPAGDVVLLHGCCHNPTGVDPTAAQWRQIADVVYDRHLLPLLDFAYQGLGDGIDQDAVGLRTMCRPGAELIVCNSFSKNFGLYRQRVGALSIIAADSDGAQKAMSHVKRSIRANYSNPPAFGAALVTTILGDAQLRGLWQQELTEMRQRIQAVRELFVATLTAKGVPRDFSFIRRQRGMFSFSGLTAEEVDALRGRHSVYIVRSGRINVAGMTEANMDALCAAIAAVLAD